MATTSSGILGQYENSLSSAAGTDKVTADKNTFLKLLVAQLTHQDPLNPQEDKEFIAQLAQFTQVEELQKISSGMETLNTNYLNSQVNAAADLLGWSVSAKGDLVSLVNGRSESSEIVLNFPRDAENVTFNVYATDANGNPTSLVYSEGIGAHTAGEHSYNWHGYNSAGARCANGRYVVSITATDADGKKMLVDTSSSGQIIGVETSADGNHWMWLDDGRKVRMNDIQLIYPPVSSGGDETDPEKTPETNPAP